MLLLENSHEILSECVKSENDHRESLYLSDPSPPKPLENAFNQVIWINLKGQFIENELHY